MNTNRNFPWWGVVLGIGCIGLLCIGILAVGGMTYFYIQEPSTQFVTEVVITVPPPATEEPIPNTVPIIPEPTSSVNAEPTLSINPEPTASGSSLTGNQQLDESRLYDDFSSEALGWPVFDDGKTILKYEEGQYSFQIAEPDYFDWAYIPVDFTPFEIWFDMKSAAGPQNGTAGVFCQFRDENNYYYVEFDLGEASYVIGQFINGEDVPLTPQNVQGQYWQDASNFNSAPGAVNRIGIGCYPDVISLFINDEWVTEVSTQTALDTLGEAAFFVYTYPFADAQGYKVYFDNVEVYKPVQ